MWSEGVIGIPDAKDKKKYTKCHYWVKHYDEPSETYGINVMQVQEVLRYTEIAAVPGAPDYVLGIINLRGNVVTVIDTRSRFGLQPAEVGDNSRIVIIEAEKQVIGILVDTFKLCLDFIIFYFFNHRI